MGHLRRPRVPTDLAEVDKPGNGTTLARNVGNIRKHSRDLLVTARDSLLRHYCWKWTLEWPKVFSLRATAVVLGESAAGTPAVIIMAHDARRGSMRATPAGLLLLTLALICAVQLIKAACGNDTVGSLTRRMALRSTLDAAYEDAEHPACAALRCEPGGKCVVGPNGERSCKWAEYGVLTLPFQLNSCIRMSIPCQAVGWAIQCGLMAALCSHLR
ncbi:unnamed protein product [Closterium sp. NIES-53]